MHRCHWPGCTVEVPPRLWGCRAHWFALPRELRTLVLRFYVPGQEVTKRPSDRYRAAAAAVQAWITTLDQAEPTEVPHPIPPGQLAALWPPAEHREGEVYGDPARFPCVLNPYVPPDKLTALACSAATLEVLATYFSTTPLPEVDPELVVHRRATFLGVRLHQLPGVPLGLARALTAAGEEAWLTANPEGAPTPKP